MNYFIMVNGVQQGPFPVTQLSTYGITPQTPVWCEGMPSWKMACEVPEVASVMQFAAPSSSFVSPKPPMPKTYVTESILIMLLCCMPFGVIGLVNGTSVSGSYAAGNYDEAQHKSDEAKKWCKWGLIGGLVYLVFVVIYIIAVFGFSFWAASNGY